MPFVIAVVVVAMRPARPALRAPSVSANVPFVMLVMDAVVAEA
jgi:hypothetical protein